MDVGQMMIGWLVDGWLLIGREVDAWMTGLIIMGSRALEREVVKDSAKMCRSESF